MAMFGDDAAPYMTPDGRTVTLPSQLAAQFPGLSPAAPPDQAPDQAIGQAPGQRPPPVELAGPGTPPPPPGNAPLQLPGGGDPQFPPSAQAGMVDLTPKPTPADAASAPVVAPSQVPSGGGNRSAGPVTSPNETRDAGPPNRDTPSQAQLARYNEADRVAGDSAALGQSADAVKQAGQAEADKFQKIGDFQAQVANEAQRQLVERAGKAQQLEESRQQQLDKIMSDAQAIRDTKIDRKGDHPILNAIAIILGGLGQAFGHSGRNLGAEAVNAQIERKVAGQMQDLDKRRQSLGTMREQYGLQREADRDVLAEADSHRVAYLDDAAKQVTAMGNQLESPIAKANAQKLLADLAQKRQDVISGASDRIYSKLQAEQARRDRLSNESANRGVAIRGQNLEDKRFYYGKQQEEREHMATLSAQLLERGDKVAAERAKRVGELGVIDPSTGSPLLTPAGGEKMAEADRREAAARREEDPARAKAILDSAQQLRDSARVNDAALAPTPKGAESANNILAEVTNAQKNIDAARSMLAAGPGAFDRDAWSKITVALEGVKVNYAQTLGEKLSVKMLEAIDTIVGIDPNHEGSPWAVSSLYERTANKGRAIAALGEIETQLKSSASTALLKNGVQTTWSPSRPGDSADVEIGKGGGGDQAGQTASEAANNAAHPGALRRLGDTILHPFGGTGMTTPDDAFDAASQARGVDKSGRALPPSNYGIDPADDAKVRAKISESTKVGNKKYGQIVDSLALPLLSDRPGLAGGVARLIADEDPRLLNDVIDRVANSQGGGEVKAKEIRELARSPRDKLNEQGPQPRGFRPFPEWSGGLKLANTVSNLIGDSDPALQQPVAGRYAPGDSPPTLPKSPGIARGAIDALPPDQRAKYETWLKSQGYTR